MCFIDETLDSKFAQKKDGKEVVMSSGNWTSSPLKKAEYHVITDESGVCRGLYGYTLAAWFNFQVI